MYHVEGVIHTYTPGEPGVDDWTKVKHVPKARALAYIDGSWRHLLRWRRASAPADAWTPLLDLSTLRAVPKAVRALDAQGPKESRRMWAPVTQRLERKEFGEATRLKQALEQAQRDEAAARKRAGVECASLPTSAPRARTLMGVFIWAGSCRCSSSATSAAACPRSRPRAAPRSRRSSRRRASTRSSRRCPARPRSRERAAGAGWTRRRRRRTTRHDEARHGTTRHDGRSAAWRGRCVRCGAVTYGYKRCAMGKASGVRGRTGARAPTWACAGLCGLRFPPATPRYER
jgi:hypothetical protein